MPHQQSEFEFDRRRSVTAKIGRTFLLLLVGAFFGIFTALVFHAQGNPWWLALLKVAIEICWTFWLFAVLYVWFEWPWLRALYLHSERRFLRLATVAKWGLPLLVVGAIAFVWYLHHVGVLPAR